MKRPTFTVVNGLLHAAVLRLPSLNALECELETPEYQKLLGHRVRKGKRAFSADTMADVLDGLNIPDLQSAVVDLVKKTERNKAFRDDTYGTFRTVAIDGWEPFSTYNQHCDACLTRQVKRKVRDDDGEWVEKKVTQYYHQYYHRFAVPFLIAPTLDISLAIEPVLSADLREDLGDKEARHEGELTVALRLIDRLHEQYGRFIDAFALDGLYSCGRVFTKLKQYLMQLFFYRRLRKSRKGRKVTDTFAAMILAMLRDVAYLPTPVPWDALDDTG